MMRLDGLLIIDKPEGITSAEVVRIVKKHLGCKTGHLGTLDPFASGVLPVCVGEGTKIAQFLTVADKEYTGIIGLGQQTDTGDPTGTVTDQRPIPPISDGQLAETAQRRHSESAIAFVVSCSKGTYVRVLAQQIGESLGTVAYLQSLRRTRFGPFALEDAIGLEGLDPTKLPLVDLRRALPQLREICIDSEAAQRARQGYEPVLGHLGCGVQDEAAKLVGPDGELAAVVIADRFGRWRFGRVFSAG
jgi:tRNA pseudouridine55 synthase